MSVFRRQCSGGTFDGERDRAGLARQAVIRSQHLGAADDPARGTTGKLHLAVAHGAGAWAETVMLSSGMVRPCRAQRSPAARRPGQHGRLRSPSGAWAITSRLAALRDAQATFPHSIAAARRNAMIAVPLGVAATALRDRGLGERRSRRACRAEPLRNTGNKTFIIHPCDYRGVLWQKMAGWTSAMNPFNGSRGFSE